MLITFDPRGSVTDVVVDKGEFAPAKASKCILGKFKKLTVPRFDGAPVRACITYAVPATPIRSPVPCGVDAGLLSGAGLRGGARATP